MRAARGAHCARITMPSRTTRNSVKRTPAAVHDPAAYTAAINEIGVDGWRAFVANRTIDLGAAQASVAEPNDAVAVRAARGAHCARITMPSRTTRNNV